MNNLTRTFSNLGPALIILLLIGGVIFFLDDLQFLIGPAQDVTLASQDNRIVEMRTVLPRDAIQSVDTPRFTSAERANYAPDELVIGVEYMGQARAYSIPLLSRHEIVNDDIRGRKIAITW